MKRSEGQIDTKEHSERRVRLSYVLQGLGLILLIWGVLSVANAGYGTRPVQNFSERRSYNMVKTSVHEALPNGLFKATAGFLLLPLGARARRRASDKNAEMTGDSGDPPASS